VGFAGKAGATDVNHAFANSEGYSSNFATNVLREAYLRDKNDTSDEIILQSLEGAILDPDNIYHRIFLSVLTKAGILKGRLHDCERIIAPLLEAKKKSQFSATRGPRKTNLKGG
jgi:hypothetical protein